MMANGEENSYLEITCQKATGSQMINLARELSMLLHQQQVRILAAPHGVTLRVHLSEANAQSRWPAIRALLRAAGLLETCHVVFRNEERGDELSF